MIKWNKVTRYSKAITGAFFIVILPVFAFYIGVQFDQASDSAHTHQVVFLGRPTSDCTDLHCVYHVATSTSFIFEPVITGVKITDPDTEVSQEIAFSKDVPTKSLQDISLTNDINFDGYKDLAVTVVTGASNAAYDYWLYDPHRHIFVRDAVLVNVVNPVFDQKKRQIVSHSNGGAGGLDFVENTYQYDAGAYMLVQSVTESEAPGSDTMFVKTIKRLQGNSMKTVGTEYVCIGTPPSNGEAQIVRCDGF